MSRNDILILFAPLIMFAMVIYGVVVSSRMFHRSLAGYDYDQQRLETFIDSVQNGKRQLTTNQWVGAMKISQKLMEADHGMAEAHAEAVRVFGQCALVGIVLQVVAIFHVRKRLKKLLPNKSRGRVKSPAE
jgi:predicted PurR-regulated permease PerM